MIMDQSGTNVQQKNLLQFEKSANYFRKDSCTKNFVTKKKRGPNETWPNVKDTEQSSSSTLCSKIKSKICVIQLSKRPFQGSWKVKKRIKQLKTVVYYLYFTSLNFYESFRISAEAIKLSNAEF